MQVALAPLTKALIADELLKHSNVDVKVAVISCISEITRITAPDLPYNDDIMKDVFQLIVSSFENLPDRSSRSYNKRALILETVAKVRSCVVMLDLECDGLIAEMFQLFLGTIRDYHPSSIFSSMETIMILVLQESDDISSEILTPLLATMKKDNKEVLPVAVKLAEKVFESCAAKIKPYLDVSLADYSDIFVTSVCEDGSSATRPSDVNSPTEQSLVGVTSQYLLHSYVITINGVDCGAGNKIEANKLDHPHGKKGKKFDASRNRHAHKKKNMRNILAIYHQCFHCYFYLYSFLLHSRKISRKKQRVI